MERVSLEKLSALLAVSALLLIVHGCGGPAATPPNIPAGGGTPEALRLGYFANVTHAQALVGTSQGQFQKALGSVPLKTTVFNAGPSVIEAFFAGELDIAYIGPSPALNAHFKSKGAAVRIISGSAANGVIIVASKESGVKTMKDIAGKRIATPQFGNTQDISARHFVLKELKQQLKENGGTVEIQNIANAEQLGLFKGGNLEVVWAPEPWGARLVHEAGAVIVDEEKNHWPDKRFTTTVVLASRKFLEAHPATVEAFLKAHVEVTAWIEANREKAAEIVNAELQKLTGKALKKEVLSDAFSRIEFSTDPLEKSIATFAQWSAELKITSSSDIKGLIDLSLLEKAKK